jgi:glycosyltransferase involved in cell wall biosynthesis
VIASREHPSATGAVREPIAPSSTTLSVVIPALNEEGGIADICQRVWNVRPSLADVGVDLELIVVDDGSRDRTAEIAAAMPFVNLIRHPVNIGYGAAIKTGFAQARGDFVAFLDADGTYPPESFAHLCRVALDEAADVVVGSRRSGGASEMPMVRRVGNFAWSNLVSIIGNHRVADPASGMRVVRRTALDRLYPLPDGLNFTPVMSTRSVHEDLRVVEVPISYSERVGRSKLSVVRDGTRFLTTILMTSLEYNPVRVLGLVGLAAFVAAGLIVLAIAFARLQGVTQLGIAGVFGVFAALLLGVAGVSIFSLGATFNYLVSLFHRRPVRQGIFERPLFDPPLERRFGWLGLMVGGVGVALALTSLSLSLWNDWDITRLWLWLVASSLLILVGLQLVLSWILMRVLEALSQRDTTNAAEVLR